MMNSTSVRNTLPKRVHNAVPIFMKINAINELERGTSVDEIAKELNVHHTTVRLWKKKKDNLIQRSSEITKTKRRFRKQRHDNINRAVWIWFKQTRASGVPITGPMIQSKALKFSSLFNNQDTFTASNGWLRSWKYNFSISSKTICGEKLSADTEAVAPFKQKFLDYVDEEGLTPDQVFNADESRLFYKLLPKTTLCEQKTESPAGMKGCKEAVTAMACSNASGRCKLPLVIIGKSAKPRALKNEKLLPVSYKSQKKAWMTGDLFKSWFENEFVPAVKKYLQNTGLPCKALLVIDNCSSHNTALSKDGITVMFFPPNTTSLIQPMDQGCLQTLKLLYKRHLMNYTIDSIDKKVSLIQTIKNITIREAINWAAAAWNEVSAETIQKSWNRVWPWATRITSCQVHSSQEININDVFKVFCTHLQNLDASYTLNASELEQWLHSIHDTDKENLSDMDIVEIVQDESQLNIDKTDEDLDQLNKGSGDDKENYDDNNNNYHYKLGEIDGDKGIQDVTKGDALLCVKYLRGYCERNTFMKSVTALDIIEDEIKN